MDPIFLCLHVLFAGRHPLLDAMDEAQVLNSFSLFLQLPSASLLLKVFFINIYVWILRFREDESKGTHLSTEDSNSKSHDEDIKSAGGSGSKSLGVGSDSNTSKELGPSSHPEELRSQVKNVHPGHVR